MAQPQRKESQPRSVGLESIDGTLRGSVLRFNLAGELDQLHQDEGWLHSTGRSSKTLVMYPDLRIVLIAMKANTRIHKHKAAGRISVHRPYSASPARAGGGSPSGELARPDQWR
jgi:hypothetical protein